MDQMQGINFTKEMFDQLKKYFTRKMFNLGGGMSSNDWAFSFSYNNGISSQRIIALGCITKIDF